MRRRFWLYAFVAYVVFELVMAVFAAPRLIRAMTAQLEATPTDYSTWTPPPTIAPLPCSRFVHPDPLQCVKGR